jgi:hypothetical protein
MNDEPAVLENEIESDTNDTEAVSESSVRDDVLSAFDAAEKAATPEAEAAPAAEKDQTNEASTELKATAEPQAKETAPPTATDSTAVAPPSDWLAEKREAWTKLPRDIQEYLVSRQTETQRLLTKKGQEAARSLAERDAYNEAIAPRAALLQSANMHPVEYVKNLVKAEQIMDANPHDAIRRLAAHYNVDLAELATQSTQQPSPDVLALRNDLNSLRESVTERQNREMAEANQRYRASVSNVVEDFKRATDEGGKPLFPHAQDPQFQQAMSAELRLVRAQTPQIAIEDALVKAYETTVWKLPHTRQAELEKQQRIQKARDTSAAKARSDAARSREVSVTGAPGASAVKITSNGTVRDDVRASMESLGF